MNSAKTTSRINYTCASLSSGDLVGDLGALIPVPNVWCRTGSPQKTSSGPSSATKTWRQTISIKLQTRLYLLTSMELFTYL